MPFELTGKQKRFLRGVGQKTAATMRLGKAGLSAGLLRELGELLNRHELIKVQLPAAPPAERAALGEQLAAGCGAALAGSVGRTVLLYRANETLPSEKRLHLPAAEPR